MRNEKLDMRMDKEQKFSAIDVVNTYSYNDLVRIFFEYGESNFSKSIAKNIVKYREHKKIEYTSELVDIINSSTPKLLKKNPSKQIFQAIRIEVNHELDSLDKALDQAFDLIDVGGRILVISFHSLEDRIVKTKFNKKSNVDFIIKGNPNIGSVVLNQIVTPEDATQRRAVSLEFEAFANRFPAFQFTTIIADSAAETIL